MRHRLIGGIELREDHKCPLVVELAVLVGARVSGGPVEKLHTEALLELRRRIC